MGYIKNWEQSCEICLHLYNNCVSIQFVLGVPILTWNLKDWRRNFKWTSIHKIECHIHNGTLQFFIWITRRIIRHLSVWKSVEFFRFPSIVSVGAFGFFHFIFFQSFRKIWSCSLSKLSFISHFSFFFSMNDRSVKSFVQKKTRLLFKSFF